MINPAVARMKARIEELEAALEPFADAWRVARSRGKTLTIAEQAVLAKHHTDSAAFIRAMVAADAGRAALEQG